MNEKLNADKERLKADLSDTVQDVKEHVAAKAGQVKEQVVAKAGQVKESARQQAQQLKGQAKEQAGKVLERVVIKNRMEKRGRPAIGPAFSFVCPDKWIIFAPRQAEVPLQRNRGRYY